MSPDEARDLFSEAFEGDLEGERHAAFSAALDADMELKAEYDDFVETFQMMGRLGEMEEVEVPNLLPSIQERIRKRSRGRYYRDRFAKRAGPGWMMPLIASVTVLFLLGVAWYAIHTAVSFEETLQPSPDSDPSSRDSTGEPSGSSDSPALEPPNAG